MLADIQRSRGAEEGGGSEDTAEGIRRGNSALGNDRYENLPFFHVVRIISFPNALSLFQTNLRRS